MDIRGQYEALLPEIKQLVSDVIDSGRFILGPNVRALEDEVEASIGYGHAVAVANGTDALELGLQALGIGAGDEVVTSAYTFFATAGDRPQGRDPGIRRHRPRRRCASTRAAAEAAITDKRTRAVMPVHIFGQPADLGGFRELADRNGIALIEDAAQAFGASFEDHRAGSYGDVQPRSRSSRPRTTGDGRCRHDHREQQGRRGADPRAALPRLEGEAGRSRTIRRQLAAGADAGRPSCAVSCRR